MSESNPAYFASTAPSRYHPYTRPNETFSYDRPGPPAYPQLAGHAAFGHSRRRRGNLPKEAVKVLKSWYEEHMEAPYPGEEQKFILSQKTGLELQQVSHRIQALAIS